METHRQTRRRWLATCVGATAGLAALAGCTDETDGPPHTEDEPGTVTSGGTYGDWPMIHYNAANRLSVPYSGVDDTPEVSWTVELDGATKQPVVYDDTVFVNHGLDTYTAIDLADGERLWNHETGGEHAIAVSDAAVFAAGDGLEALDHGDGDVLWTSGHDRTVTSIRIYDDTIYAGLEDSVVAFNEDGDEVLELETPEPVQSLAIDDDHIYVRSREADDIDDFVMLGYDRDSGERLWKHEISHAQQWVDDRATRTFPVIDETVYTVTDDEVIAIDGDSGNLDEIAELDHTSWTRPTIHDDIAHLQRGSMAYDLETGEQPDEWDSDGSANLPISVGGQKGYTVASAGVSEPPNLVAMDITSGETEWTSQTPERANYRSPVVLEGMVLLSMDEIGIVAFG